MNRTGIRTVVVLFFAAVVILFAVFHFQAPLTEADVTVLTLCKAPFSPQNHGIMDFSRPLSAVEAAGETWSPVPNLPGAFSANNPPNACDAFYCFYENGRCIRFRAESHGYAKHNYKAAELALALMRMYTIAHQTAMPDSDLLEVRAVLPDCLLLMTLDNRSGSRMIAWDYTPRPDSAR